VAAEGRAAPQCGQYFAEAIDSFIPVS